MKSRLRTAFTLLILPGLAALVSSCSDPKPGAAPGTPPAAPGAVMGDLKPVTGPRPARLVWLEQDAPGSALTRVFAHDAADGLGIRALTPNAADFAKPLLTTDGSGVVYTRLNGQADGDKTAWKPQIFLQPWNGPAQALGEGMAVEVWRDPASGAEYIYAADHLLPGSAARPAGEKLVRFSLTKPAEREIVWTASTFGVSQFQLSRDGRRAAGLFPFPKAGLADLTNQTFTGLAAGSWPAGASDDSYATAVLDGSRRRLRFFAPNLDPGWELTFMGAPGWEDGGLLHPRWSNDPGLMVFTGPYAEEDTAADLCLVRFREDLRAIDSTARLTKGRRALYPDLWVGGADTSVTALPQQPVVVPKPAPRPWPVSTSELSFAWDRAGRTEPLTKSPAALTPREFATWSRYQGMELTNGWFEADPAAAASVATASAASNAWAMELILTERPAPPPVSVRLAALISESGQEIFALYRAHRKLVLRVLLGGTPERPAQVHPVVLTNLAIEADRPVHLVMSLRNNRLSCWLDGQMQKDFQLDSSGLAAWGPGTLSFGDPQPFGSVWAGSIDRVAMWSRALGDDEIRASAETALQWMEPRTRVAYRKIKGTLTATAPPPTPLPDNLLSVSLLEVNQVLMGQVEGKRIGVATWSRLHGRDVPSTLPPPGQLGDLIVEAWDDHPELESVPRATAPGAADLPLYFYPKSLRSKP